jgi:transforming growth factor-beta-induced protein
MEQPMYEWLKRAFIGMVTAGLALTLAACGGSDDDHPPATVVAVAQSNGFNALVAAVNKAGLATALSDPNATLTVFAPTDAAFNTLAGRLGFADATAMVNALPASALSNILSYHVLATRRSAADLGTAGTSLPTLYQFEGRAATLALSTSGGVSLTDAVLTAAKVSQADINAGNGVVHVVDKVLVPPGVLNLVQMAQANPAFSTLVGAVKQAGLDSTLAGAGPLTVFAPTNEAFAAISSTVAALTPSQLSTVLTYHVVAGRVLSTDITLGAPVSTVSGQSFVVQGSPLRIIDTTSTPAPIAATDVRASNGVIHVISKVLIPSFSI